MTTNSATTTTTTQRLTWEAYTQKRDDRMRLFEGTYYQGCFYDHSYPASVDMHSLVPVWHKDTWPVPLPLSDPPVVLKLFHENKIDHRIVSAIAGGITMPLPTCFKHLQQQQQQQQDPKWTNELEQMEAILNGTANLSATLRETATPPQKVPVEDFLTMAFFVGCDDDTRNRLVLGHAIPESVLEQVIERAQFRGYRVSRVDRSIAIMSVFCARCHRLHTNTSAQLCDTVSEETVQPACPGAKRRKLISTSTSSSSSTPAYVAVSVASLPTPPQSVVASNAITPPTGGSTHDQILHLEEREASIIEQLRVLEGQLADVRFSLASLRSIGTGNSPFINGAGDNSTSLYDANSMAPIQTGDGGWFDWPHQDQL